MKYGQLSDVLLHEVFVEGELISSRKMRSKKTLHNIRTYHTLSSAVGKVAKITRCKKLVLTHFVPTHFNKKKIDEYCKKRFWKKSDYWKRSSKNINLVETKK